MFTISTDEAPVKSLEMFTGETMLHVGRSTGLGMEVVTAHARLTGPAKPPVGTSDM